MPLYAYLYIPGVECSESTDKSYGREYIPISKMDLRNSGGGEDEEFKKLQEKHEHDRLNRFRARVGLATKKAPSKSDSSPSKPQAKSKEERNEAIGEITVTKMLDSTSAKLQEMCLTSINYDPDEYLDGRVEIHICREIPDPENPSENTFEIYMAYMMENCLITSIDFSASESDKLEEEITISFEVMYAYTNNAGKWETKGWDFVEGEEVTSSGGPPSVT